MSTTTDHDTETTGVECNWPRCTSPRLGKCRAWCKCRCHAIKPIADQPATMVFTPSDLAALVAARVAEALAPIEALFAGGPDTPCRTRWREERGLFGEVLHVECVEVPMEDLRAALPAPEPTP